MGIIKLLKAETLSGNRIRNIYKINDTPISCCGRIMGLSWFSCNKIRLTTEGEEMHPDNKIVISLLTELLNLNEKSSISSCLFKGLYVGSPVDIVIDFGLSTLSIVTDNSKVIELIERI